ncbi:amidohydrolase family protein [Pseudonocardia adelaidensis]|uniref:Amidohydrolase family protein n=1 Tax=Pseudonocardia adelaidensis TaxID=648754 RepID=A0ABP9NRT6_9PSEU
MGRIAVRAAALFDGAASLGEPVVLISDGCVVDVACGPRASVPADAELVELPGATLLPGLVDTHVHLAFDAGRDPVGALVARADDALLATMADAARAQLRAGVTTVRDLGDRGYLALGLRDGAVPGPLPTIVAAGPPITTPGGHCHFLGGEATGVDGVRAAVRERAERGVDVVKVMASGGELTPGSVACEPQFTPDELRALVDEAHRCGLPVTAHSHALDGIRNAVAAGFDGIEHCGFRTADGVEVDPDLVAALARQRVAVGFTGGIAPSDVPPPPQIRRLLPAFGALYSRMWQEGVLIVLGTDAGIGPSKPHPTLPYAAAHLASLGVPALDVLRTCTATAAQVCGLGERKGRIAPGYDADLVAVPGDPLADLAVLHEPLAVFVRGERIR